MSEWVLRHSAKMIVLLAAATFFLVGLTFYILYQNAGQETRITEVRTLNPCTVKLRGNECQRRTCIRLYDVGYHLSQECRERLDFTNEGVDISGGNKSPSGSTGPPSGGPPPQTPNPPASPDCQVNALGIRVCLPL